ncbi:hypothetical protein FB567DRAFT_90500 [Paraphoma chrysanthemicola]|uniref:Zn(2)-C6 fungal-type domain-containing protein n=1 Tax=Paraphoma chrysanthemicola TaxID=798071 RepID=A0A8K0R4C9_9PLEO|nr:hypothetical protein FB567DRAFT_90500 [Paraphoma chrysanthemicola]
MPRLGHKKSRLGCRQCKARHVKCDELKPCSNCARHGVPCSLVTGDLDVPPQSSAAGASGSNNASRRIKQQSVESKPLGTSSSPSPSLLIDYVLNPPTSASDAASTSIVSSHSSPSSSSDQFPFLTKFIHRTEKSQADIWALDLELMHHWTIEAFDELSQRDDMRHTWRVDAPQKAVSHAFFMHEILAFSALHKAFSVPEQRSKYYTCGIHHQDLAIRGVRERLHHVTEDEAAAIMATSTLLTLSVFASIGFELNCLEIPCSQDAIEGILNIFSLMQGMKNVLEVARVSVTDSWLSPMLQEAPQVIPPQPLLQDLVHQIATLISFIHSRTDLSMTERNTYLNVIGAFEPVLKGAMYPRVDNRELRFLFLWPVRLSPDFIHLVRQRSSGALAILMYYSTMLFAAQSRYWFMQGWGEQMIRTCSEAIGADWLPCVQWPMSFVNHQPTYSLLTNLVHLRNAPVIGIARSDSESSGLPHTVDPPPMHYSGTLFQPKESNSMAYAPQRGQSQDHPSSMVDDKRNVSQYG